MNLAKGDQQVRYYLLYDGRYQRALKAAYKAGVRAGRATQFAAEERQTSRNRTDRIVSAMLAQQGRFLVPPSLPTK